VQVTVQTVQITGNTVFTEAELLAVLGDVSGKSLDLAGLRNLANQISDHYHAAGYPFARAYLPAQTVSNGTLRIEVVEGAYGEVRAQGEPALAAAAQAFLDSLRPGQVIANAPLERATLLLSDQPGIGVTPLIRPGRAFGTGDLDVTVEKVKPLDVDVGVDNQGNYYTGRNRAHLSLNANSPLMLGDQVVLRALATGTGMWFGNLGYNLPLGTSGLRGQVGYAHTYYELGKDFRSLQGTGTANVTNAGLSYPLLRSQRSNLGLSVQVLHKTLHDNQGAAGTSSGKSSNSLPVSLSFDHRDGWSGITYGSLTGTVGRLSLDPTLTATDASTARTRGGFSKLNLDLARSQAVGGPISAFGRLSAQWADKNLDSSEGFGLGGATGVRAYPEGEAFGDAGWLAQLELRYASGDFSPYAFYDAGHVKINAKPWASGSNTRHIGGPGVGLRYRHEGWSVDAAAAWRTQGGKPESDRREFHSALWVSVGYHY
jgi:hemolysin activation/secretion protein